jgi:hypothetical protein
VIFIVPSGELESWLGNLNVDRSKSTWLVTIFQKMGEKQTSTPNVSLAPGDIWDVYGKKWSGSKSLTAKECPSRSLVDSFVRGVRFPILASVKWHMREALLARFGEATLADAWGWFLALGLLFFVSSLVLLGLRPGVNPTSQLSGFSAFATTGYLKWLALPVAVLGGVFLLCYLALHFDLRSIHVGGKL